LTQKIAIKFEENAIRKTEICKKQAQKTSKFQLKQAQKQATRKSSKKPARLAILLPGEMFALPLLFVGSIVHNIVKNM